MQTHEQGVLFFGFAVHYENTINRTPKEQRLKKIYEKNIIILKLMPGFENCLGCTISVLLIDISKTHQNPHYTLKQLVQSRFFWFPYSSQLNTQKHFLKFARIKTTHNVFMAKQNKKKHIF